MPWTDPLLCAVHFKSYAEAIRLLQQGYPPDDKTNNVISPLHLAVENNDIQMCKLLLDYNANVNWCDGDGQSPIFNCTGSDISYEIFDLLLTSGGKIDICDVFKRTPLHYSVNSGAVDRVKRLIQAPGVQVNAKDYQGFSALHHVMTICDIETGLDDIQSIIKLLLDAGADPNLQDNRGLTALHLATTHDFYFVELTTLLLSYCKNIDFKVKSQTGDNFLHLLFNKSLCEENAVQLLEDLLCGKFVPESIFALLLNMRNKEGLTPFFLYMSNPFEEGKIFMRLLSLGADVTLGDNIGVTPLMTACWQNNIDYVLALIHHGACINSHDIYGRSTVYRARSIETVSLLLEHGVDLQTLDKFGRSVLCQNLLVSDLDCVEYLIHKGGNVNQQDRFGSSPLHYAAYANDGDLIKLLLKHNADPCLQDQEGHTAQDVAKIHKCKEALQVLQGTENVETPTAITDVHDLLWSGVNELRHPEETCNTTAKKKLKLNRDIISICEEMLKEQSILLSVHNEENDRICRGMTSLMETVAQRMGQIEEVFTASLFPSGSVAEGTKTGKPNEFDFIFCLTKFANSCDIVEEEISKTSGLVKARSRTKPPPDEFSHFIDDTGFIITQNVRVVFNELLSMIIREEATWKNSNFVLNGICDSSEDVERPAFSVQVTWMSCRHKQLDISVDMVPAIYPQSWWPRYIETTTMPLMTKAVKDGGCLLLALSQEERGPEEDSEFNFRISCLPTEKTLMVNLPQVTKDAYVLAKVLISNEASPAVTFSGDGVTTKDYVVHPSSVIKSYMLKNCLLHILSEESSLISECQEKMLSGRDLTKFTVNLTIKIFRKLQQLAGEEHMLPVYFLPSQNILNYEDLMIYHNDPEEIQKDSHDLAAQISVFCSMLLDCLTTQ